MIMSRKFKGGFDSEYQIDMWGSDAKIKARLHQQRANSSSPMRRSSSPRHSQPPPSTSLNRLRERTRQELTECSSVANRLQYMQQQVRRRQKLVENARYRYQKVVEARSRSATQKKQLAQQRKNQMDQHRANLNQRVMQIRLDRRNSNLTHSLWRSKNQQSADEVKNSRIMNQSRMADQLKQDAHRKRQQVQKGHRQTEASRERLRKMAQERQEEARRQHHEKLLREFARSEMQRRKRARLLEVFKEKAEKFQEMRLSQSRELKEYSQILGKCFRGRTKSKESSSFYLTH